MPVPVTIVERVVTGTGSSHLVAALPHSLAVTCCPVNPLPCFGCCSLLSTSASHHCPGPSSALCPVLVVIWYYMETCYLFIEDGVYMMLPNFLQCIFKAVVWT